VATNFLRDNKSKLILLLGLVLMGETAMSYEEPKYTVVYADAGIEYRQYDSYLVSETIIKNAADSDAAGNEGFRRLFRYITGANKAQSKISMTVPVSQGASEKISMTVPVQKSNTESGWRVSFALPSEYTLETAPQPTDARVYVREVPGRLMAVKRFSGRWTERNYLENEQKLRDGLQQADVEPVGELERAAYNAPFSLPFLRRNEVMAAVNNVPVGVIAADAAAAVSY